VTAVVAAAEGANARIDNTLPFTGGQNDGGDTVEAEATKKAEAEKVERAKAKEDAAAKAKAKIEAAAKAKAEAEVAAKVEAEKAKEEVAAKAKVDANTAVKAKADAAAVKAKADSEAAEKFKAAEQIVKSMLPNLKAKCQIDKIAVLDMNKSLENLRDEKGNLSTTADAAAMILNVVSASKAMASEDFKALVEGLTATNSKGVTRNLKFNKRAQNNPALPLAIYGYDHVSDGHVSKIATVIKYADALEVTGDEFHAFINGPHGETGGTGFKNAYKAALAFFSPSKQTAEQKAQGRRAATAQKIKQAPSIGTIDVALGIPASKDGFYCLIAVQDADGKARVLAPVPDTGATLIGLLLDNLSDVAAADRITPKGHVLDEISAIAKGAKIIAK
ncbi:MAG: hypothetical protein WCJ64_02985, partial [Rhodospirillaceae bacterium]